MLEDVIFLIYFSLPGAYANMAPVPVASKNLTPYLNKPIDFKRSFRGKRILGDNKTFRGLDWGFLSALAVFLIQLHLYNSFDGVKNFSQLDYTELNWFMVPLLMTLGALGGDAIKSFFKRQLNRKPGESWIPFDQMDSVVGILFVASFYYEMTWGLAIVSTIVGSLLHPLATTIAWLLKWKKSPL